MKRVLMARGARILAEQCASIKPGETVLVVTDYLKVGIAEMIAAAVRELDAEVIMTVISPTPIDGAEPPRAVAEAMKAVDCVIMPVSKSLAHTDATRAAIQEAGARVISMTAFVEEQLMSGGLFADFRKEKPVCDRIAQLLNEAKTVRVTTQAGMDLRFSVEGRPGNSHCCIVDSAGFTAVPNIEANISPVEGTTQGVIVCDGSIHIGIGTSSNLGGSTKAATHFDVIIRNATVAFDEKIIIKNGELKI